MRQTMDWQFWDHPDKWPIDPPGYVFLARAVQQIGRAKFGPEWDYEPPSEPADQSEAAYDAWEQTDDAAEAKFDEMQTAVSREIAKQSLSGRLLTAARPRAGGEMINLSPSDWNAENLEKRFECCQIAMNDRFGHGDFASFGHWIYVQEQSLQSYLATLTGSEPGSQSAHLMKAVLGVIKQLWPNGPPHGLKAGERNTRVIKAMRACSLSDPSPATIRRALKIFSEQGERS